MLPIHWRCLVKLELKLYKLCEATFASSRCCGVHVTHCVSLHNSAHTRSTVATGAGTSTAVAGIATAFTITSKDSTGITQALMYIERVRCTHDSA
jgi:hypothetical protein